MSISLDLLAFTFCLLVDCIKLMRESNFELFLEITLLQNFQLDIQVNMYDCVRAFLEVPYKLPKGLHSVLDRSCY